MLRWLDALQKHEKTQAQKQTAQGWQSGISWQTFVVVLALEVEKPVGCRVMLVVSFFALFFNRTFKQGAYGQQPLGRAFGRFLEAVNVAGALDRFGKRVTRLAAQLLVGHFRQAAARQGHGWTIGVAGQSQIKRPAFSRGQGSA